MLFQTCKEFKCSQTHYIEEFQGVHYLDLIKTISPSFFFFFIFIIFFLVQHNKEFKHTKILITIPDSDTPIWAMLELRALLEVIFPISGMDFIYLMIDFVIWYFISN